MNPFFQNFEGVFDDEVIVFLIPLFPKWKLTARNFFEEFLEGQTTQLFGHVELAFDNGDEDFLFQIGKLFGFDRAESVGKPFNQDLNELVKVFVLGVALKPDVFFDLARLK